MSKSISTCSSSASPRARSSSRATSTARWRAWAAVGLGLRTKVNANIGTSRHFPDIKDELVKLKTAVDAGADAVMDLSTGGDLTRDPQGHHRALPGAARHRADLRGGGRRRRASAERSPRSPPRTCCDVIERQAKQGVDFMTVHCGHHARVHRPPARSGPRHATSSAAAARSS